MKVTHMLDHIFPRERKIRSLIGVLETSMGTRGWEPLAKSFAATNDYIVCDEGDFNNKVPIISQNLLHFIAHWEDTKFRNTKITLAHFWVEVNEFVDSKIDRDTLEFSPIPKGQGVDVIL